MTTTIQPNREGGIVIAPAPYRKNKIPLYGVEIESLSIFHAIGPWPRPDIKPWGSFRYIPGVTMDQEAHHHHELLFVLSPIPLRHTGNGQVYETHTPAIIYRAPYTLHSTMTLTDSEYERYVLWFNPEILEHFGGICRLGKLQERAEYCISTSPEQMQELRPLLDLLIREQSKSRCPGNQVHQQSETGGIAADHVHQRS